ncbi:MAG: hypothetical protein ACLQVJ_17045 [Syntrophobacteraceae bacterium]
MTGLDHAGWTVVGYMVCLIVGGAVHWLFQRNDCTKCGISELKAEIITFRKLLESLWEKAGLTVKERLEIESLETK